MNLPPIEKLHHAIILTGTISKNKKFLETYFTEQNIQIIGNPDIVFFEQETLKINDFQEKILPLLHIYKTTSHRLIIICVDRIERETREALLKSLEEPLEGTHIILLLPTVRELPATIVSRVHVITGVHTGESTRLDAGDFFKKTLSDRFVWVESWTKNKNDEDNVSKYEVIAFCNQLEKFLWDHSIRDESLFIDIRKMREYAHIRGASHRLILDYLAMVCPILK